MAQDNPVVFKGALIYPVTGAPIEKGILIVQNGKIVAIGDASTPIPSGAQVIDASNLAGGITTANVMPGSGHLMSGQTIYLKMRPAMAIEDMLEVNGWWQVCN